MRRWKLDRKAPPVSCKRAFLAALGLLAASCAPTPAPPAAPVVAAQTHAPTALAAPASPVAALPELLTDSRAIGAAQQNLHQLGYGSGKASGILDAATRKAIVDFQKDQSLTQDGRLTAALADKLRMLRAELPKTAPSASTESLQFVYSDGLVREQPANYLAPKSWLDDAGPNFLQPLRPGTQGTYHLGHRGKDGVFAAATTVTCHVGHLEQTNVPAGLFDTIATDCDADGKAPAPAQWRWFFAPKLGQVVRQSASPGAGYARDLVAIRPSTASWPSAARTGLDWALTSALEAPAPAPPVQWSSTGIAQHFEIHVFAPLSPSEAGLAGGNGPLCRRFELVRTNGAARHYPGIACKDAKGVWYLPGSRTALATPAAGLSNRAAPQLIDGHGG